MEKQTMKLNRKVLSKEKEIELSTDIIVPDIKPDIVAILNTNANAYIYREEILTGSIRVDGNADGYVIYLSENGETRSLAINLDFSQNVDDERINEKMNYKSYISLKNIEARVLNERKINVNAKLVVSVEIYESTEVNFITNVDGEDIQKLEQNYKLKRLIGSNKSKASIKEEMSSGDAEGISEILKTEIEIKNIENKVSYNKILAKADADIKIIYQTENMKTKIIKGSYPVMSFIDVENVQESNICETEFKLKNMLFKINTTDSNKVTVQVDFESYTEVYETQEITAIEDMYSLNKELKFTKKEIEVALDNEVKSESTSINEKVQIEDLSSVVDVSSKINLVNKTVSGSYSNYELEAVLDIMYEMDSKQGVNSRIVRLPFMVKLEENSQSNASFEIVKQEFNAENDEISCNIEVACRVEKNRTKKLSLIENVEEEEAQNQNEYSMVVYFVKPNDTIWKIAKMFKVKMQSIIDANDLENPDKINIGDKLYIVR